MTYDTLLSPLIKGCEILDTQIAIGIREFKCSPFLRGYSRKRRKPHPLYEDNPSPLRNSFATPFHGKIKYHCHLFCVCVLTIFLIMSCSFIPRVPTFKTMKRNAKLNVAEKQQQHYRTKECMVNKHFRCASADHWETHCIHRDCARRVNVLGSTS